MAPTLLDNGHDERRRRRKLGGDGIDVDVNVDFDSHCSNTPIRFLPLHHVYSATSPCTGSSNVVSKKIRARKLTEFDGGGAHTEEDYEDKEKTSEVRFPEVIRVYSRRRQKKELNEVVMGGGGDEIVVKEELVDEGFDGRVVDIHNKKRQSSDVAKLGGDSSLVRLNNARRLRESRFCFDVNINKTKGVKRKRGSEGNAKDHDGSNARNWFLLTLEGAVQTVFIGLKCEVYWPLDNAWYKARIAGYDAESNRHIVKYDDGDEEELVLSQEQIKFYISKEEMQKLNLKGTKCMDDDDPDYSQLIGLAATVDESRDLEPGDIIWAKVTGHAMWPAVIMDESLVSDRKGLNKGSVGRSLPVQFFGSHDFARVHMKQIVSFVKGLVSCFHLKCKSSRFLRSLKEAKTYLNEQKLPKSMLSMQCMPEETPNVFSDEASGKDEVSSYLKAPTETSPQKKFSERYQNMPSGYRGVRIDWKDLDRCNVCHMDEEYENNLFLQCDKCRMMVHSRCYGEESAEGLLWLCNLCRAGAPESTPPCRLCPVVGGAMKRTTDGHWAHLACAIWIPETCLSDIKRMEPIDGLSRINKDRWKLLCNICSVPYGACIQCSNNTCRVAYHPLCARAAGLCVEPEDEDRLHLMSFDEDEEDQCIRLLSFCKKHKQSKDHPLENEHIDIDNCPIPSYIPPLNASGCARCEPYDYSGRRGRKEPEVLAAASVKRLYVENRPYLVGGHCQHDSLSHISPENGVLSGSTFSMGTQASLLCHDTSQNICSMSDKYSYMRETFRNRLAFGKSRIHGFGIFAKQTHRPGDMIIEYIGEIVRPSVADRREHIMYNSLVGAGTYMFRIDDERVIDATRAGSIAHLINHSCEPNCYSRVITVDGDKHIIIFAKREIKQWEELTYDYRFFALDEQLACHCGFKKCRGVVNDLEAEEQASKHYVPRSELIEWKGE